MSKAVSSWVNSTSGREDITEVWGEGEERGVDGGYPEGKNLDWEKKQTKTSEWWMKHSLSNTLKA